MIAVAAGDEVALQLVGLAAVPIAHRRVFAVEAFDGHVAHVELELGRGGRSRFDQILGHLRLPVDGDLPAGQALQVNAQTALRKRHGKTIVDDALLENAVANLCLEKQFHRPLLEHTGANPPFKMLAALPLENDIIDALQI